MEPKLNLDLNFVGCQELKPEWNVAAPNTIRRLRCLQSLAVRMQSRASFVLTSVKAGCTDTRNMTPHSLSQWRHESGPQGTREAVEYWAAFLQGPPYVSPTTDLNKANTLLQSSNRFEQLVGRLVIQASSSPDPNEIAAILEDDCKKGFPGAEDYARGVLLLQLYFPLAVLLRPAIRSFTLSAALSHREDCRINGAHVLGRLAPQDAEALSILVRLRSDSNQRVARNAEALWQQLSARPR
jgi:hypothetical protein